MFYVKLYDNNELVIDAPFVKKEDAIKYFNLRVDVAHSKFFEKHCDYIELVDGKTVLFECEV